jgi:CxxC-x17-CxxC domain-containing protein
MSYTDQVIACADCGTEFNFTAAEQEFYAQKGFASPPKRCKPCREAAKAARGSGGGFGGPSRSGGGAPRTGGGDRGGDRQLFDATCAACGVSTQVPFKPSGAKPVYCRDCFRGR